MGAGVGLVQGRVQHDAGEARKVLGIREVDDNIDTAAASRIWDGLA